MQKNIMIVGIHAPNRKVPCASACSVALCGPAWCTEAYEADKSWFSSCLLIAMLMRSEPSLSSRKAQSEME